MFDNLEIRKAYKVTDDITGNVIEVCTFNATLNSQSGVYQNMNINYPNLYKIHKDNILLAYREFNSNIIALGVTMDLATTIESNPTILTELETVRQQIEVIATDTMNEVIASLGNIVVNPVPITYTNNPY